MKKILSLLLILVMAFVPISAAAATEQPMKILINGVLLSSDVAPVVVNGSTLVPMRAIFEKLDANVTWDNKTQTATAVKDNIQVMVTINSKTAVKENVIATSTNPNTVYNVTNITLLAAPQVKNDRTLVPLRFISESLGAVVNWDAKTNTAIITKDSYEDIKKKLDNKIKFDYDIRLFTLFAFMNFTGYNDENNMDYNPVRKMIRDKLNKMDLKLSDNNYYKNKKMYPPVYTEALLFMKDAPGFEYTNGYAGQLGDLSSKLKEFYEKANVPALYEKYKSYYTDELQKYKIAVLDDLAYTIKYLKINIDSVPQTSIQVNLLDSYERGYGGVDAVKGAVVITGPSNFPNRLNIVHEFLHRIFNAYVDKYENDVNSSMKMTIANSVKNSVAARQGYTEWESITDESFVRAVSILAVYRNTDWYLKNVISGDTNDGFIMTQYIFDKFDKDYPKYTGGLENFVKSLLSEYKM